jgi:hypothetical protein
VTLQHPCDLCGNPSDPSAFVCARCSDETAGYLLHVVNLAAEVETTVARLARYATRAGVIAPQVEQDDRPDPAHVNRRQPVGAFGWPASKERPKKGALRASSLPVDLNASARAAGAFNAVTTWARQVEEERGVQVPDVLIRDHPSAVAAQFLIGQLDWIRHQPFADEANEQLRSAGAVIKRIVDAPPEREIVGVCDCGAYLYAYRGAAQVACTCSLRWQVKESRKSLMDDLRDRLVTVAEAATLGVLAFPVLQRKRVKNLVESWVRTDRPNHLIGQPTPDGPVYPFGDILDRLSRSVVRFEGLDRVNVSA